MRTPEEEKRTQEFKELSDETNKAVRNFNSTWDIVKEEYKDQGIPNEIYNKLRTHHNKFLQEQANVINVLYKKYNENKQDDNNIASTKFTAGAEALVKTAKNFSDYFEKFSEMQNLWHLIQENRQDIEKVAYTAVQRTYDDYINEEKQNKRIDVPRITESLESMEKTLSLYGIKLITDDERENIQEIHDLGQYITENNYISEDTYNKITRMYDKYESTTPSSETHYNHLQAINTILLNEIDTFKKTIQTKYDEIRTDKNHLNLTHEEIRIIADDRRAFIELEKTLPIRELHQNIQIILNNLNADIESAKTRNSQPTQPLTDPMYEVDVNAIVKQSFQGLEQESNVLQEKNTQQQEPLEMVAKTVMPSQEFLAANPEKIKQPLHTAPITVDPASSELTEAEIDAALQSFKPSKPSKPTSSKQSIVKTIPPTTITTKNTTITKQAIINPFTKSLAAKSNIILGQQRYGTHQAPIVAATAPTRPKKPAPLTKPAAVPKISDQDKFTQLVSQLTEDNQHKSKRNFIRRLASKIKGAKNYSFQNPEDGTTKIKVKIKNNQITSTSFNNTKFNIANPADASILSQSVQVLANINNIKPSIVERSRNLYTARVTTKEIFETAKEFLPIHKINSKQSKHVVKKLGKLTNKIGKNLISNFKPHGKTENKNFK